MCAINISPEAGDASINIMSTKRCSTVFGMGNSKNTFLLGQDKNLVLQSISTIPPNSIGVVKDNVNDECVVIPDYPLRRINNIKNEVDYCGFPCYRSDSFQDAVLVKDVGVSCSLLNENVMNSNIPISGVESYLIRQLKLEYNELSSITKKINTYTKDILSNLAIKCKRKDQALKKLCVASKHNILASQHAADETGNPYLKLQFCDDTKKKYRSSRLDLNHGRFEQETGKTGEKMYDMYLLVRDRNREKRRVEIDKAFLKKVSELSPKCSGVLLHNYLIMKKEKASGNALKMPLRKVGNLVSPNAHKNHNVNKSFYTTKCDPSVLTNWQEVSRRKNCKFKSAFTAGTSGKSRCTVALDSYSV